MASFDGKKKHITPSEITVYTDGSKTENGVGVGYVVFHKGKRIQTASSRISDTATVFLAEVRAIYDAVAYLLDLSVHKKFGYVKILSDSQAAITALDNRHIKSKTVHETSILLNSLQLRCKRVTLAWIKAHVGTDGNEQADQAAKEGANSNNIETYLPKPWCETLRLVEELIKEEWNFRWTDDVQYVHSKHFYPQTDTVKSKKLLEYSRAYLQLLVRALTGHNFLAKHQNRIGNPVAPECRLCLLYTSPSPRD